MTLLPTGSAVDADDIATFLAAVGQVEHTLKGRVAAIAGQVLFWTLGFWAAHVPGSC